MFDLRRHVLLFAFGCGVLAALPMTVAGAQTCSVDGALHARTIAGRYRDHKQYPDAAHWFTTAADTLQDCTAPADALLGARSLIQAGAALAEAGDYLRALEVERQTRLRLQQIAASHRPGATAAQAMVDEVDKLITSINIVAQASM